MMKTTCMLKANFMLRIHGIPDIMLRYSCEIPGILTILTTLRQKLLADTWALELITPPLRLVFKFSVLRRTPS